ncbi:MULTISPECIES: PsbP-related protein [Clostridium]|uniref:PsbP-related protein n=1 Tax=Clostridium TaxID=1485 RepID=UPI00069E227C|nr:MULTISPECIES: hypothetical protein [Clostridium]KOF57175.1 hypothetical protein AGR56_11885 [Clostridium sp. DMHC 10]MCD2348080.1 hypothetical protein [Clostridium guangxiense]
MKFVIINGRKLGGIVIVVGLMLVLFGVGSNLSSRIRSTAYIQSNMGQLKKYSVNSLNINYMLPAKWKTNIEKFGGNEILYHNDFRASDNSVWGFVEVWNKSQDLKTFLNTSKEVSEKQNNIEQYTINEISVKNEKGYIIEYTLINKENKRFKAIEYFIEHDNKFIRFSFYTNSKGYTTNMKSVFKAIVETLNY